LEEVVGDDDAAEDTFLGDRYFRLPLPPNSWDAFISTLDAYLDRSRIELLEGRGRTSAKMLCLQAWNDSVKLTHIGTTGDS
jgi:hypothetical protein